MKSPFTFTKTVKATVPSTWPNRQVRRAIKYGKALPGTWTMFFAQNPVFFELVRSNKFAA